MSHARVIRGTRSQRAFSRRFGIPLGTLRAIEQGRPPSQALAIQIEAIRLAPDVMAEAARAVLSNRKSEGGQN